MDKRINSSKVYCKFSTDSRISKTLPSINSSKVYCKFDDTIISQ